MKIKGLENITGLSAFSFPTTYQGITVVISVTSFNGHYGVLFQHKLAAEMQYEEDFHSWFIAEGELNDDDLAIEIGKRIEAKMELIRSARFN